MKRSPKREALTASEVKILVTDGRTATQRASEPGKANLVLVDLALDYMKATRLAVAKAQPVQRCGLSLGGRAAAGGRICRHAGARSAWIGRAENGGDARE